MPIYRMVKLNETKFWNYKFGDGVKVFGCYVYDPEIHTYCASLFPSYELNFVYTDVTREITEEENSMICEAERESSCYADVYWIGKMPYTEIEADNIDEAIEELNANWRDVPENGHYDVFGKLVI